MFAMLMVQPFSLLARSFRRLREPLLEFGPGDGCLYLADRVLRSLHPSCGLFPYEFFVQQLPESGVLPVALAKHVAAEHLVPGHPLLNELATPHSEVARRFAAGAHAVAAVRKGKLLGYAWWCESLYLEREVRCMFVLAGSQDQVFDFDVYVLPEQRMGLGFMAVWHVLAQQLRAHGVVSSVSRISRFNLASRRAHARLGARPIGRAVFLRLGAFSAVFLPMWPFCQLVCGRDRNLQLMLHQDRIGP